MSVHYDLNGKVAVVTGAAGGFGAAIVKRLEGAGATPVLWDLPAALGRLAPGQAVAEAVDVTDEASVTRGAETLMRRFGRIDILINNAGIVADPMPAWEIP